MDATPWLLHKALETPSQGSVTSQPEEIPAALPQQLPEGMSLLLMLEQLRILRSVSPAQGCPHLRGPQDP